jgi:hypothetical protein
MIFDQFNGAFFNKSFMLTVRSRKGELERPGKIGIVGAGGEKPFLAISGDSS